MSERDQKQEFPLPGSVNEGLVLSGLLGFVLLSCGFSVWSLVQPHATAWPEKVAALVWLGLCLLFFGTFLYHLGLQKTMVRFLRTWSDERFLKIAYHEDKGLTLWSGFRLFGHTFRCYEALVNGVESLEWCLGQASARMGKDMDDRLVYFTVSPESVLYSLEDSTDGRTLFTGLGGSKPTTEQNIENLVAFLQSHGVALVEGEKPHQFLLDR